MVVVVVFGKIIHTVTGSLGGRLEQVLTFLKSVYVAEYDVLIIFPNPDVNVVAEVDIVKFPGVAILIGVGVEDLLAETRLVEDQVVFVHLLVLEFEDTDAVDTRNDSDISEDEIIFDV